MEYLLCSRQYFSPWNTYIMNGSLLSNSLLPNSFHPRDAGESTQYFPLLRNAPSQAPYKNLHVFLSSLQCSPGTHSVFFLLIGYNNPVIPFHSIDMQKKKKLYHQCHFSCVLNLNITYSFHFGDFYNILYGDGEGSKHGLLVRKQ